MRESDKAVKRIEQLANKRLKTHRINLGITQEELSKAVSIEVKQIKKLEEIKESISSGLLYVLSNFLKLPIADFIKREGEDKIDSEYIFKVSEVSYETNDNYDSLLRAAEEPIDYIPACSKLLPATQKELENLIKDFSKIKNLEIRNKIMELIKTLIPIP